MEWFNNLSTAGQFICIGITVAVLMFLVFANNKRNQTNQRGRRGRSFRENYETKKKEKE